MSAACITYHLTAQDEFLCLAGECPTSCCSGWQIAVEPELVERWKQLPDPGDRTRFPGLVRVESHGAHQQFFMTGRDHPRCGLLMSTGLCEAHARYGVEYTPHTCRMFPRMQEETDRIRMESASPACPVIARRVVCDDPHSSLFIRTPTMVGSGPPDLRSRPDIVLSDLLDRLVEADQFPLGVRMCWLAEKIGPWKPGTHPDPGLLARLDLPTDALHQELAKMTARTRSGALEPDPVIAGSFWNTLFQLGHHRELIPLPDEQDSALRAGLRGLPADRRRFYAAVHAELQAGRAAAALDQRAWYPAAANRLLQLNLLNAGFPWQPSLGDPRMSFVHALMLFALTHLQLWLAKEQTRVDAEAFIQAVVHTGRAFGHNTLILEQIRANPALLDLHRYHATWLDL